MRRKKTIASVEALSLALGLALFTLVAAASAAPSRADKEAARALLRQGDEKLEQGKAEAALKAYRRADDIMGVPTTTIEVGRLELELGRYVEAQKTLRRAVEFAPKKDEPPPFAKARQAARELLEQLAKDIPTVVVSVQGKAPPGVVATIDEQPIELGRPQPLDLGRHELEVRADDHAPFVEAFQLKRGDRKTVVVNLHELASASPAPALEPWVWPLTLAGGGVAAAGVVVGAVTGGVSLSEAAEAKRLCRDDGACTPDAAGPLDRSRSLADVSTASFVLAGVGAAAGSVGLYFLLSYDGEVESPFAQRSPTVKLGVGPTSVGLTGRF